MDVIDNFLDQSTFENLEKIILGYEFPWYFNDFIDYDSGEGEGERFQFIHIFYRDVSEGYQMITNPTFELVIPIIEKLESKILIRVKANLLTQTSKIIENQFHRDIETRMNLSGKKRVSSSVVEKLKPFSTSIFYMNTNNGYTKFEDGTTVKSKANRMVTFPANMRHSGTSCTDQKSRVVINFNYFK